MLDLKVALQLLQLFGEMLVHSFHFLFMICFQKLLFFLVPFFCSWHNELIHKEAATWGLGGHLLETVLLVEEVFQLHL